MFIYGQFYYVLISDSQNKVVDLSAIKTNGLNFLVINVLRTSKAISTSVDYGACDQPFTLNKHVYGENDSILCVAITDFNTQQERKCFIATIMTNALPTLVRIQGELKGESI